MYQVLQLPQMHQVPQNNTCASGAVADTYVPGTTARQYVPGTTATRYVPITLTQNNITATPYASGATADTHVSEPIHVHRGACRSIFCIGYTSQYMCIGYHCRSLCTGYRSSLLRTQYPNLTVVPKPPHMHIGCCRYYICTEYPQPILLYLIRYICTRCSSCSKCIRYPRIIHVRRVLQSIHMYRVPQPKNMYRVPQQLVLYPISAPEINTAATPYGLGAAADTHEVYVSVYPATHMYWLPRPLPSQYKCIKWCSHSVCSRNPSCSICTEYHSRSLCTHYPNIK